VPAFQEWMAQPGASSEIVWLVYLSAYHETLFPYYHPSVAVSMVHGKQ
jgi:hypothetical protein